MCCTRGKLTRLAQACNPDVSSRELRILAPVVPVNWPGTNFELAHEDICKNRQSIQVIYTNWVKQTGKLCTYIFLSGVHQFDGLHIVRIVLQFSHRVQTLRNDRRNVEILENVMCKTDRFFVIYIGAFSNNWCTQALHLPLETKNWQRYSKTTASFRQHIDRTLRDAAIAV